MIGATENPGQRRPDSSLEPPWQSVRRGRHFRQLKHSTVLGIQAYTSIDTTPESAESAVIATLAAAQPGKLVTHRFTLDGVVKAYDTFGNAAKEGALKVILKNGGLH